jgi:hypothetical protein
VEAAAAMMYYSLAGELLLEQGSRSVEAARAAIARELGVHPRQLHVEEAGGGGQGGPGVASVVCAASFRVSCGACGAKIECSCGAPEGDCECMEAQAPLQEGFQLEDYCSACFLAWDERGAPDEERGAPLHGAPEQQRRSRARRPRAKKPRGGGERLEEPCPFAALAR